MEPDAKDIAKRFLSAIEDKLESSRHSPTSLAEDWNVGRTTIVAWRNAVQADPRGEISVPDAVTIARVCVRENLDVAWVLTGKKTTAADVSALRYRADVGRRSFPRRQPDAAREGRAPR